MLMERRLVGLLLVTLREPQTPTLNHDGWSHAQRAEESAVQLDLTLRFAKFDPSQTIPGVETILESDELHMGLSDTDYALLATVFTDNLWEEGDMPACTLAVEEAVAMAARTPTPQTHRHSSSASANEEEGSGAGVAMPLEKMYSAQHNSFACLPDVTTAHPDWDGLGADGSSPARSSRSSAAPSDAASSPEEASTAAAASSAKARRHTTVAATVQRADDGGGGGGPSQLYSSEDVVAIAQEAEGPRVFTTSRITVKVGWGAWLGFMSRG